MMAPPLSANLRGLKMEIYDYNFELFFNKSPNIYLEHGYIKSCSEFVLCELGMQCVGYSDYTFGNSTMSTGVFLLSTSHWAWHTFPEHNKVSISFSTCKEKLDIKDFENLLKKAFDCSFVSFK